MKIFVLGKRYNMDVDSVLCQHGRSFHLPLELARSGHHVRAVFLDYRTGESFRNTPEERFSISVTPFRRSGLPAPFIYLKALRIELTDYAPDVVLAGGDALNVVIGYFLAKWLKRPLVLDLKDDYLAFRLTHAVPCLAHFYRKAIISANRVITVSPALRNMITEIRSGRVLVIENAVPRAFCKSITKQNARRELGLPENRFLFGTAGSLRRRRNIHVLLEGAAQFLRRHGDAVLVLAGARSSDDLEIPPDIRDKVVDLGLVPPSDIPLLFSALDLGLIMNSASEFGQHCYPQKYKEMAACKLPVAAAKVGIFSSEAAVRQGVAFLFNPDDSRGLASGLEMAFTAASRLEHPRIVVDSWHDQASKLDVELQSIFNNGS